VSIERAEAMRRLTGRHHWGQFRSLAELPRDPQPGDTANIRNKRYRWQGPSGWWRHMPEQLVKPGECAWRRLEGSYPIDLTLGA
jgi:hypothetical protein